MSDSLVEVPHEASPPADSAPSWPDHLVPTDMLSPLTVADPPPSSRASPENDEEPARQPFYIDVPLLPAEAKEQYSADVLGRLHTLEEEADENRIISVIGEYEENGRLYYFAKYADGIAHRVRRLRPLAEALFLATPDPRA